MASDIKIATKSLLQAIFSGVEGRGVHPSFTVPSNGKPGVRKIHSTSSVIVGNLPFGLFSVS